MDEGGDLAGLNFGLQFYDCDAIKHLPSEGQRVFRMTNTSFYVGMLHTLGKISLLRVGLSSWCLVYHRTMRALTVAFTLSWWSLVVLMASLRLHYKWNDQYVMN